MNNMYLIPANSKKSLLIFSVFRLFDLILFGSGAILTLIFLFVFSGDSILELVIKLSPVGITGLLVMPIPYYHNVLVFLTEVFNFFKNRRIYLWKGWCANYGTEESK